MKILLADPPWFTLQGIQSSTVSLGLSAISSVLEQEGHEVAIWNGDLYNYKTETAEGIISEISITSFEENNEPLPFKKFRSVLKEFSPDLVGITSMTAEFFSAQHLAKIVKDYFPSVPVVVGGVHPTIDPKGVLDNKNIDYVVIGEGEETVRDIAKCLNSRGLDFFAQIRGLGYRRNEEIIINDKRPLIQNIDNLPLPSYKGLIDISKHAPAGLGGVISSRGCPYTCSYCASENLWTRKVRYRSIIGVIQEIESLYQMGIRVIRMNDDAFTINRKRVIEFCKMIMKFSDLRWSCDTRVELVDKELLRMMRKSGCYQINVGVESGSHRIQKVIKKHLNFVKVSEAITLARQAGIRTTAYFMIGFPDESMEEIKCTLALLKRLKPTYPIFSTLTPYPGTEMWQYLKEKEKLPEDIDYSHFYHHSKRMNYSSLSNEEFACLLEKIEVLCSKVSLGQKLLFMCIHPLFFFKDRRIINPQLSRRLGVSVG